jgi:catechol 2,3-dioxygenase-like lactoylglutathione lyase family enzyme
VLGGDPHRLVVVDRLDDDAAPGSTRIVHGNILTGLDASANISTVINMNRPPGRAKEPAIMRLQLALNVSDLDEAVDFYSKMFATEPYKVKPGYANWEIENPPLKLVVFERADAEPGSINHLGVETESADEVIAAEARVAAAGLRTSGIDDTICCFAEKLETWVQGPEGHRWEWYVKQADHETQLENVIVASAPRGNTCCS